MNFTLPRIYPLTDTRLSGLLHAEQVEKLTAGGAKLIQLREKQANPDEFYIDAGKAIEIARAAGAKIIINDRVDIALALKADGVHLGQDDMPPAEARKLLGNQAIIGLSTHNSDQAREALAEPINYIAFGPIYPTLTKNNPDPVTGIEKLLEIRKLLDDFPLVAIGGIDSGNYREVLAGGADSAAIISALFSDPTIITERIRSFLTDD